jgi:spermidine synthase
LGKRADNTDKPLLLYARLEAVVALLAAITPLLLGLARKVYLGLGGTTTLGLVGGTAVRLLLSVLVLAGPTVAMGGTLPAAVRAVESSSDAGRWRCWGLGWEGSTTPSSAARSRPRWRASR